MAFLIYGLNSKHHISHTTNTDDESYEIIATNNSLLC